LPIDSKELKDLISNNLGLSTDEQTRFKVIKLFTKIIQLRLCSEIEQELNSQNPNLQNIKTKLSLLSSKSTLKYLHECSDKLNIAILTILITKHKGDVQIKENEVNDILSKCPDVSEEKKLLEKLIEDETRPDSKKFDGALRRLCLNQSEKQKFQNALAILNGKETSQYSTKPHLSRSTDAIMINNAEYVRKAIVELKGITSVLQSSNGNDEDQCKRFCQNPTLVLACEYAFNIFVDRARKLAELISSSRTNTSSIFVRSPEQELQQELESYVLQRNIIFHFNDNYTGKNLSRYHQIGELYDAVMKRTEGEIFNAGIVIDQHSVRLSPISTDSLDKKFENLVTRLEITLPNDSWIEYISDSRVHTGICI